MARENDATALEPSETAAATDTTAADWFSYGLMVVAFVILVVLAFLGKAAEMTVLGAFTAIGLAFIKLDKFTEFSALGFSGKLKDVADTVNAIKARETEPDPEDSPTQFGKLSVIQVSPKEKEALKALRSSSFTFRSVGGIAEQLEVSRATAVRLLHDLSEKGLVSHSVTSKRRSIWSITEQGLSYLQNVAPAQEQDAVNQPGV